MLQQVNIANVRNAQIVRLESVSGVVVSQSAEIALMFSLRQDECISVSFSKNEHSYLVSAERLIIDPIATLVGLSTMLDHGERDEVNIMFDNAVVMHVAADGNHLRFTQDAEELVYWVCDEFAEEYEVGNILAAILGLVQ